MTPQLDARVTHRQLQASYLVARQLPDGGCPEERLRASLARMPTGALHNVQSLTAGQAVLEELGLLVRRPHTLRPTQELLTLRTLPVDAFVEALLLRRLTLSPDLWLAGLADADTVPWEFVPDDISATLASTFPDPDVRDAFVLNAARKVDQAALAAFGALGEETVVAACRAHLNGAGRANLASDVAQVSLNDDTLGYDIVSPDTVGSRHRMEVKATSAVTGWVEFYLSRNEATVGRRDPAWSLVVTRRELDSSGDLTMRVAGWLNFAQFQHLLAQDPPRDGVGGAGRWASCRITLPDSLIHPGLPLDSRAINAGSGGRARMSP